ncbi:hypothetical protein JTE90_013221 [Oedothorax gibbosus]|uniref:Uncharacterized protein n=1 Tax=Oedothorax gibbosus TaxID=931172 RepID=A0AAV6VFR3_9ARAC|nr:hypothetical protein JTE90_013221 [Oedothorax gibbosus]
MSNPVSEASNSVQQLDNSNHFPASSNNPGKTPQMRGILAYVSNGIDWQDLLLFGSELGHFLPIKPRPT